MNLNLRNVFLNLENNFSLTDIFLPFILIFAIIYAISDKVLHFRGQGKKFNLVVSLVLSLMTVIPHVTGAYGQFDIINIINSSIPQIVMIIVGVILALMLIGATGGLGFGPDESFTKYAKYVALAIVGLIIWSNVDSNWYFGNIPILGILGDPDIQAIALILIVFGGIVAYVTSDPEGGKNYPCHYCGGKNANAADRKAHEESCPDNPKNKSS